MTNEEAKQQAIINAYGEYWGKVKDFVTEDGWFYNRDTDFRLDNTGIPQNYDAVNLKSRPKSLQGIENNNGWIRIESENDLPKYDCECFVKIKQLKEPIICRFIFKTSDFIETMIYTEDATHWQPIITPKPPIY